MHTLVVYESMFGNTRQIAAAVAEGLARHGRVDLVEVDSAPATLDSDVDLIVVGGPTHAHGMSRRASREGAAKQDPPPVAPSRSGMREWIASVGGVSRTLAATFDTRFDKPRWLTGSAAVGAARHLRRRGCVTVVAPESFYVDASAGPVHTGERDRARAWGEQLATAAQHRRPRVS